MNGIKGGSVFSHHELVEKSYSSSVHHKILRCHIDPRHFNFVITKFWNINFHTLPNHILTELWTKDICQRTVCFCFTYFLLELYAYMLNNLKYAIRWKSDYKFVWSIVIRKEQVGQEIDYAHVHAFDQNQIKSAMSFMMYMIDSVSG